MDLKLISFITVWKERKWIAEMRSLFLHGLIGLQIGLGKKKNSTKEMKLKLKSSQDNFGEGKKCEEKGKGKLHTYQGCILGFLEEGRGVP